MTITETLNRFVEAQQLAYASALNETRGAERSHWISVSGRSVKHLG